MEAFFLFLQTLREQVEIFLDLQVPPHAEWLFLSMGSMLLLICYLGIRTVVLKKRLRQLENESRRIVSGQQAEETALPTPLTGEEETGPDGSGEGFAGSPEQEEISVIPAPTMGDLEESEPGHLQSLEEEATEPHVVLEEPVVPPIEEETEASFFQRLKGRLGKTHDQLIRRIDQVLSNRRSLDADVFEELEEVLVTADLGVKTSYQLLGDLQKEINKDAMTPEGLKEMLKEKICSLISIESSPLEPHDRKPFVIMVVGVNGVGKTTTVGKLAARLGGGEQKVMLVAADTFRPAAIEQLHVWSERVGADFVKHKPGADPSAVVYDAMHAAASRDTDIVLVDTAGRLHTKANLMEELKKVKKIMGRELEGTPHEIFLVLDATTGQNAIHQARIFHEALGVTGIILTKLDGTAKGGIIVGIVHELQLPVRFIGIGEQVQDLRAFNPNLFLDALFGEGSETLIH